MAAVRAGHGSRSFPQLHALAGKLLERPLFDENRNFVLAEWGFVCHEPHMSARRILQSFNRSSKTTKKAVGISLLLLVVAGFAACRATGADEVDSADNQLNGVNGAPLPYKPNLNLM
jgi:hypothetical protein